MKKVLSGSLDVVLRVIVSRDIAGPHEIIDCQHRLHREIASCLTA